MELKSVNAFLCSQVLSLSFIVFVFLFGFSWYEDRGLFVDEANLVPKFNHFLPNIIKFGSDVSAHNWHLLFFKEDLLRQFVSEFFQYFNVGVVAEIGGSHFESNIMQCFPIFLNFCMFFSLDIVLAIHDFFLLEVELTLKLVNGKIAFLGLVFHLD